TQLGDWLGTTLPNLYGAGANKLKGKTNVQVAAYFQSLFVMQGPKVEAEVLATALAVYVTNATLDNTNIGSQYGFQVTSTGLATATWNVGANGDAFGVANNSNQTILDLLLGANAQAVNGKLYNGNSARRTMAINVFDAINQAGDI